ncbi:MAG TPA: nicotinate (nicotinamide) nucleotide adenylyltransferase [Tissierellia bacterium]|jgi:nicotinate-nucleotide adenylyltransferase|nr:nicotinate (nicotinamide) nucleotide adenylyltransferase [Tissierellia bacterium]
MKIGIFGGSFDPIHMAHLLLAQKAAEQFALDRVHFVVAYFPPHRAAKNLTEGRWRLQMVREALRDNPLFVADDRELVRAGTSYTLDTLESFGKDNELYFLLGADSLFAFEFWYEPAEILKRATILVGSRPPHRHADVQLQADRLMKKFGGQIHVFDFPWLNISSTSIREDISQGRSARYQITEPVRKIIEERGLYR